MNSPLKAAWEVRAGVIPGQPQKDLTKRWNYTSEDRALDERQQNEPSYHSRFAKMRAEAIDYYVQVSLPMLNNWAEISFIWY